VASNAVSREVVEILNRGGEFSNVRDLVAGARGVKVFENGDLDAGIWSVGTAMGLINDIPTVEDLVSRIVSEAEELICQRLADMVSPTTGERISPWGRQTAVGSGCQSSICSEVSPSTRTSPW
jgi:hypothetical protein